MMLGGPIQYGLAYIAYWLATDVSPVTVANQLWIPLTTLFAFLLLKERLGKAALGGMVVAFVGFVGGWTHALLGPQALGVVANAAPVLGASEIGVVMLLFVLGHHGEDEPVLGEPTLVERRVLQCLSRQLAYPRHVLARRVGREER